jgi:nicotinamidase/pyrazinamidase
MKRKIASVNVDPQKGFTPLCPNELPVPEGDKIVPALLAQNALAEIIVGSSDAHSEHALFRVDADEEQFQPLNYENTDCTFKMHCRPGTKGFELLDGLPKPTEYDFFVWKGIAPDLHPYGACYHDLKETLSTGLIEYLVCNEVTDVLVGGLATDYCVATTAKQLQKTGKFRVVVNLQSSRGITQAGVEAQIAEMVNMGIVVADTLEDAKRAIEIQ